jgi:hypothetical protein
MVCLIIPEGPDGVLRWFGEQLDRAKPDRVPHALIQFNEAEDDDPSGIDTSTLTIEDVKRVRRILHDLSNELVKRANGSAGRFHVRLFSLLDWLMDPRI